MLIEHRAYEQPFHIGKEILLVDATDPLARVTEKEARYREIVTALKLQTEDQIPFEKFDEVII